MAHQDYVSRSSNKKNNPYKKSKGNEKAETQNNMPVKIKLIGAFTLIAITMFAYFLWSIKDNQANPQAPTKSSTKQIETAELPAPPEEKWTYVDGLKTKEIEVGEYEVKKTGPYAMQCGSFRSEAQAETLKAQIAFNGISSLIKSAKGKSGLWYKVVLGPYERKRTAEKDKHKLKNNKITGCQIWLWK